MEDDWVVVAKDTVEEGQRVDLHVRCRVLVPAMTEDVGFLKLYAAF